jgi:hypothetical protein
MAFPVPKDVRTGRDFEPIELERTTRRPFELADPTKSVDPGEWMKMVTSGGKTKAAKLAATDDAASPALGAKVSWTRYRPGDLVGGQSDAGANKLVDLLGGRHAGRTKLYVTASSYAPGDLLVPVYDPVTERGVLDSLSPLELERSITHDAADSVVAATKTWTFTNGGFSAADVGRKLVVANASTAGNNGTFTIATAPSGTTITTTEAPAADETFGGTVTQQIFVVAGTTALFMQYAVARVIEVASGVLHYEAPAF